MFKSIVVRSALQYVLVFGGMALVLFIVAYMTVGKQLLFSMKSDLQHTAREFAALLATSGYDALVVEVEREILSHGTDELYVRVLNGDLQHVLERKPQGWSNVTPLFLAQPRQLKAQWFDVLAEKTKGNLDSDFIVYSLPISPQGWIQVGQSLATHERILNNIIVVFGWALVGTILLGLLAGIWQMRNILQGVALIRQTAINIGQGALDQRVSLGNHGQELDDLARAFNTMLDRVDSLLEDVKNVSNHVAHDLRSPLSRMRGLAETTIMAKHKSVQASDQTLGMIVEECDHLNGIIDTILEIAQADSGFAQMQLDKLDMNMLLTETYELFLPMAEQRNIQLNLECDKTRAEVSGDKMKLQRVLANVLDNAIKFTPDFGVVGLSIVKLDQQLCVSITDTGGGIAQEDMPNVLNLFYRAEKSRSSPGNGLGLSYVASMMKAHGGDVHIESEIGQGTQVQLLFPIV